MPRFVVRLARLAPALALAMLLGAPAVHAENPRLVRVTLDRSVTLPRLLETGADVVGVKAGSWADVLLWPGDDTLLAPLGARVTLRDANPGRTAAERARASLDSRPRPVAPARAGGATIVPQPGNGSLGGFWTLAEVKAKLDQLVATDTRGLVADKLDTLGTTLQGRPVWGLQLGTTVAGTDTRPVVYYNALTHAREPEGMQALFFFVDDLLANYASDPAVRYLMQNRRIYIVPVVNPDGYFYNQRIYDSTGTFGLWRKNLRDNNNDLRTNSADGVDINRNYGFKWGFNNVGSSPTTSAADYRGPSAFSEPETRIQRDAVVALKPVSGLSFHTYSDLFVHPWGWTVAGTPDSAKFQEWSDELTLDNGFTAGPGPRILYDVNGEFNDWTYGDTLLKPKAYTWTPEVGGPDDGFWPAPTRIDSLSLSTLRACYTVAGIAGPWVRAEKTTVLEGHLDAGHTAHLAIRARNLGATGLAGPLLSASLTAISPEVEVLSGPVSYPSLGSLQSADPVGGASFWVAAADTMTPGRMVNFRVDFTDANGLYCRDTIEVIVGTPTVLLTDPCESLSAWSLVSGLWGVVANDPAHPDRYLADTPAGAYPAGYVGNLQLASTLDLSHGTHAWVLFEDRWAFESNFDGAVLEASPDGVNWTALPTRGTTISDANDVVGGGLDAFEGTRWRWRPDRADLGAVAGGPGASAVRLRWRTRSDGGTELDGLNVDSIRVVVYDPAAQPAPVAVGAEPRPTRLAFAPPSPNPVRAFVRFTLDVPEAGPLSLDVIDVQGRTVYSRTETVPARADGAAAGARYAWGWDLRCGDGRRVAPGMYLARIRTSRSEAVRRMVVLP